MMVIYVLIAIVCVVLLLVMAASGGFAHDIDMGHDIDIGGHDVDFGGHDVGGGHDADLGHYDAGHGDFSGSHLSPLSVPILLAFGATFGAMGAILDEVITNDYIVFCIAIMVGIVVAGGMYGLVYALLVKSQASTHTSMKDFVGLDGLLTVGIRNRESGEVVVNTEKRGRVPVPATATHDIGANTAVKVIGIAGDAVIVEKKE
jgi:hypothetical protein